MWKLTWPEACSLENVVFPVPTMPVFPLYILTPLMNMQAFPEKLLEYAEYAEIVTSFLFLLDVKPKSISFSLSLLLHPHCLNKLPNLSCFHANNVPHLPSGFCAFERHQYIPSFLVAVTPSSEAKRPALAFCLVEQVHPEQVRKTAWASMALLAQWILVVQG